MMKFLRYWFPLIVFAGLIFLGSDIPGDGLHPVVIPGIPKIIAMNMDKIFHATIYGFMGWLSLRAFALGSSLKSFWVPLCAFLLVSFYGVTDEIHQSFVVQRSCDAWDWGADSVGSFLVIFALNPIYAKRSNQ